jgi:hypothetical protein
VCGPQNSSGYSCLGSPVNTGNNLVVLASQKAYNFNSFA